MADAGVGKDIVPELRRALAPQLPAFLMKQRWFGGKARKIESAELSDIVPIRMQVTSEAYLLMVSVKYADGNEESYAMPVVPVANTNANVTLEAEGASLHIPPVKGGASLVLADALRNEEFLSALLELIRQKGIVSGENGELRALQTTAYSRLYPSSEGLLRPKPVRAEQSNSSIIYGDRLILKFFRRMQEGINPDLEIGKFLTEKTSFAGVPPLAGSLEYHTRDGREMVQGILQQFVANEGDAWSYTLRSLAEFYERAAKHGGDVSATSGSGHDGEELQIPKFARDAVDPYLGGGGTAGAKNGRNAFGVGLGAARSRFRSRTFYDGVSAKSRAIDSEPDGSRLRGPARQDFYSAG